MSDNKPCFVDLWLGGGIIVCIAALLVVGIAFLVHVITLYPLFVVIIPLVLAIPYIVGTLIWWCFGDG